MSSWAEPEQTDSLSYELLLRKSCAADVHDDATASTAEPESDGRSCAASSEDEVPSPIPAKDSVQLLRNVPIHGLHGDAKMAGLVQATRDLSKKAFDEDCLTEVTKKSGWKLSLLVSADHCTFCGFIVSKVAKGALLIAKLAVPAEFRGSGFGRLIMDEVIKSAKQQGDVSVVCLSSLAEAVKFYQRLGFKALKNIKMDDSDDLVEGQVYMEKKLRTRRK
jgi:ribosomal protein S18 acetylase RimI-like enzyme